mmetsp:Transcript_62585/g.176515  ORF Transcript_62585/g.176515 Transcript_62585/m.176515 type:complete len:129 (-) Transcript_62585:81-467(-)
MPGAASMKSPWQNNMQWEHRILNEEYWAIRAGTYGAPGAQTMALPGLIPIDYKDRAAQGGRDNIGAGTMGRSPRVTSLQAQIREERQRRRDAEVEISKLRQQTAQMALTPRSCVHNDTLVPAASLLEK